MDNKVVHFLKSYLESIRPLKCSTEEEFLNYYFMETGHIDSFGLIAFIVSLEDEFDIVFEPEDTESDEFRHIAGLVKIIEKKLCL